MAGKPLRPFPFLRAAKDYGGWIELKIVRVYMPFLDHLHRF